MKIYEFEGVRTYRRSHASAMMAKQIVGSVLLFDNEPTISGMASRVRGERSLGGAYLSVQRALPFEYEGLLYRLVGSRIVCAPGSLEDVAPPKRAPAGAEVLAALVKAEMAKLEPFVSIYALREEARKLLDGVEERLMKKIEEEVKKQLTIG